MTARLASAQATATAPRDPSPASPTSSTPRHLSASKAFTLRLTSFASGEQRMRAGGEILQPRSDREHQIGVAREHRWRRASRSRRSRRAAADDPSGARLCRPASRRPGRRAFRRTRRSAAPASPYSTPPPAIEQRTLRALRNSAAARASSASPGGCARKTIVGRREEILRIIVGHRLHVLRQRQRHRTAERGDRSARAMARGSAVSSCAGCKMRSK